MLNIIRRIMLCTSWFALTFLSLPLLASTTFNVHLSQFPLLQGFNTATVNMSTNLLPYLSSLEKNPISGIIQLDSAALKPLQIHLLAVTNAASAAVGVPQMAPVIPETSTDGYIG